LTGIIAIPIVTGILYYGSPLLFLIFFAGVALAAINEYFTMIDRIGIRGFPILGMILSLLLILSFYFNGRFMAEWGLVAMVTLFGIWFLREDNVKISIDQIAYTLFGVLYIAGLGGYYLLIRKFEDGGILILFVFFVVWMGDIAAYYWGKNFGKTPIAPLVSPNKTVEGSFAGVAGSLLVGIVFGLWVQDYIMMGHCLLAALICGTIGQFGDLAESLLKRHVGVKDSGNIVPGHGGLLDRIDSLLFAGPAFYCYCNIVLKPGFFDSVKSSIY